MAAVRTSALASQAEYLAYKCDVSQVTREPTSVPEDVDQASYTHPSIEISHVYSEPPVVPVAPVVPEDLAPMLIHPVIATARASQPGNPVVKADVADQSSCSDQSRAYEEEEEVHHLRQVEHLHLYPRSRESPSETLVEHSMAGMADRHRDVVASP